MTEAHRNQNTASLLALVACVVGDLAAGLLGYATGGPDGGAIGAIAFALGLGVVGGLLLAVGTTVGGPDDILVRPAVGGAVAVAGWAILGASVLEPGAPMWTYLVAAALVGVALGTACESAAGGLWHGTLAGGAGGVLTVYLAIYESFTMRPELGGIVLLGGVVAPLALGVAGGLGGAVGVVTNGVVERGRVSE
ncbi:hypothetical protein [Halorussus ruber]|uniref:hypothetical protein n=1 Tax=Halorussus ruber TaxID=1126238 RepID=UPI001091AF59|nr:hypothetical protein [Halorussus ruber]